MLLYFSLWEGERSCQKAASILVYQWIQNELLRRPRMEQNEFTPADMLGPHECQGPSLPQPGSESPNKLLVIRLFLFTQLIGDPVCSVASSHQQRSPGSSPTFSQVHLLLI